MPSKPLRELHGEITSFAERSTKLDVLYFVCPVCTNGHGIVVSWEPPSLFPSGAIWKKSGSSIDDLTITPSINCAIGDGCTFHGWVRDGQVVW